MVDISATENEFRSQVTTWLNGYLEGGAYPFECVTADPSITGETRGFPDVVLWLNRAAKQAFCIWELKTPETSIYDSELLERAREKSNALGLKYFLTWNMREAALWEVKNGGRAHAPLPKTYEPLWAITTADNWYEEAFRELLKRRTLELLDDLTLLYKTGRLTARTPDERFFVHLLRNTANSLFPLFFEEIRKSLGEDKNLRENFYTWARRQGIAKPEEELEPASRQAVYRLLCKIIFYEAVRSHRPELPELTLPNVAPAEAQRALREGFARAKSIDWYAVFEDELIDELPWPANAVPAISDLLSKLQEYSFYALGHDVIGAVFEQLIPYPERHQLGQYFTREDLVDFILGFCVQTSRDDVFDPTCGTGTFLLRAYDRLWVKGKTNHRELLASLWGNDIAHFAAALATINLFRQELTDTANFPRVEAKDFFDITRGEVFKFPPPTGPAEPGQTIDVPIPQFDAVVGNFPFIRQELIEKRVKGYKDKINADIAEDWPDYSVHLSGQADIYAFMFFHAAAFLKPGGRLGIVTSNAWLDTAYGYELQKFFLEKFKLVAVVESRCEPWFDQAAVNTVFTVLERCDDGHERDNHVAKFVKVRRPLKHIFPQDLKLQQRERWTNVDARVGVIEHAGNEYAKQEGTGFVNTLTGVKTLRNGDFRIRIRNQRELREEIEAAGRAVKWGRYLRAPDIYFEIKEALGEKLKPFKEFAEIYFGIKTGINDFFYLTREEAAEKGIEEEYLIPVLKSPKDSDNILIEEEDVNLLVFVCRHEKSILKKKKHIGALKYIEEGEKKRTAYGVPYPNVKSVSHYEPGWWSIRPFKTSQVFCVKAYDDKLRAFFSEKPIACDQRLYYVKPHEGIDGGSLAALLNSSLINLFRELIGPLMLGEGVLDISVENFEYYLELPTLNGITENSKKNIMKAFAQISRRPIKPVSGELKEKDRRAFDRAILEALELDPEKYLEPLYAGVTELVGERLDLARKRENIKKERYQKDLARVKKNVEAAALADGFRKFPDWYIKGVKESACRHVGLTNGPYRLGHYFMGQREVLNARGEVMYRAESEEEAKYVVYSYQPETYSLKIPQERQKLVNAVTEHERYLREKYDELFKDAAARAQDVALAERLTTEIFDDYGIPLIFLKE